MIKQFRNPMIKKNHFNLVNIRPALLTILIVFFTIAFQFESFAFNFQQESEGVEMATKLREDGKIWGVVGVVSILLILIFVYLLSTERKLKKLENQIKE